MTDQCHTCGHMFSRVYLTDNAALCWDCWVKQHGSEPDDTASYTINHR